MTKKQVSLRKQFLTRTLGIMVIISIISSGVQLYLMKEQVNYELDTQTSLISQSINQGFNGSDLASKSIEHQIDLKMAGYLKYIGEILDESNAEELTDTELIKIKENLNLAGLSILEKKDNDIVVVKSTDPNEIGFSTRSFGDMVYQQTEKVLMGEDIQIPELYSDEGLVILPIMQSGTYQDKPVFFKYAYFHKEGTNYILNPYISADEVYQFTESVGPESLIKDIEKENPFVKDISILDPNVFQNPELESQYWPPMKKIVYGDFQYQSKNDPEILKKMVKNPKIQKFVEKVDGKKIYKLFLPQKNGQVIHIAFDYEKIISPLHQQSIILIVTGIIGIVSIFLLIYQLFNRIYINIQKITTQIDLLKDGDLTAESDVNDGSELTKLSIDLNVMASNLNQFVKEIEAEASKTQMLSEELEEEASQSVEKIYTLSTETTLKAREQLFEITEFLDSVEKVLESHSHHEHVKDILGKMDKMREVANERTAATTNTTITLSDLLQSLYGQSQELSEIASNLMQQMSRLKL
ncbi:methyl-accepting chemotaxis protein [Robertmurraya yapensis]|uniref:Methyl-accepting chemotaxis protein n=1 Tax=Bacillus yapensis TaxID=2492960 RepID=A0A3S0K5Q5_9BACI|nr:methyl-accepting chemotaxis protein [Bacillus yapensis]RTR36161.1 methyl-accepting chemotaxis protein [Bacillus yapensis]TKT05664.1 methyl-accepting chemotaxis protein [Bacillus yapensis]